MPLPPCNFDQEISFTFHMKKGLPQAKFVPKERYQMGKGDPCRVMFLFHAKHHSMRCLGKWVSYSENPPNLGEFGCLKPLLGGMRWSSSIGIARIKKKL